MKKKYWFPICFIIILGVFIALFFQYYRANFVKKSDFINRELPGFYDINFDSVFSKEENNVSPETKEIVQNYYRYFWEGNNLSGSFIIAKGNTIIFEGYRGLANKDRNIPITSNMPIHLASISKNLTAMAVLKLVEAGKLKLTSKVSSILPKFPYKDIKIFDLLTHRSGMGDYGAYAETEGWFDRKYYLTNAAMLEMFAKFKPKPFNPPNTAFDYCNTNYAFLALVIEKITKKPFPQAMKMIVFDPIGMKNTFVFQKKDINKVSLSYFNNGKIVPWDFRDLVYGDKNIYSTPCDMLKYSQAMFSKKFLRKSLLDSAFAGYSNERKGNKNYGFGFRMFHFDNGKKITFHNGWWHGNQTVFVHLRDEKVTIIALGNQKARAIYSAYSLSSIFGDYPFEIEDRDSLNVKVADTLSIKMYDLITKAKKKSDSLKNIKYHNENRKTKSKDTLKLMKISNDTL